MWSTRSKNSGCVSKAPQPWPDRALVLRWALRVVVAGVLLFAGLVKAGDTESFALALAPFTFVPPALLPVLALGLPGLEIALGLGLLLPWAYRQAALVAAALFTVFLLVIAWALSENLVISCGCFGEEDELPSEAKMWGVIFRNALLTAAALWIAWGPPFADRQRRQ